MSKNKDAEFERLLNNHLFQRANRGLTADFWAAMTEPLSLRDKVRLRGTSKCFSTSICRRTHTIKLNESTFEELFGKPFDPSNNMNCVYEMLVNFGPHVEKFELNLTFNDESLYEAIIPLFTNARLLRILNPSFRLEMTVFNRQRKLRAFYIDEACQDNPLLSRNPQTIQNTGQLTVEYCEGLYAYLRRNFALKSLGLYFLEALVEAQKENLPKMPMKTVVRLNVNTLNSFENFETIGKIFSNLRELELIFSSSTVFDWRTLFRHMNKMNLRYLRITLAINQEIPEPFLLEISWPTTIQKFSIVIEEMPFSPQFIKHFTAGLSTVTDLEVVIKDIAYIPVSLSDFPECKNFYFKFETPEMDRFTRTSEILSQHESMFDWIAPRVTFVSIKGPLIDSLIFESIIKSFPNVERLRLTGTHCTAYSYLTDADLVAALNLMDKLCEIHFCDFHYRCNPNQAIKNFANRAKKNPAKQYVFNYGFDDHSMDKFALSGKVENLTIR